jgi:glycerol-3-phosphate acyltransferase PlsY
MVLIGDTFKGVIGAAMGMVASGTADPQVHWAFAAGLAAVIGHCYPVFHRFKGGKGVATGLGVLLFTAPIAGVIIFATWAVLAKLTKTASIASFVVIALTPPLMFWQGVRGLSFLWLGLTIALVVWRHKGNIRRMINRTEQKVVT